jgi:hypothetical protein
MSAPTTFIKKHTHPINISATPILLILLDLFDQHIVTYSWCIDLNVNIDILLEPYDCKNGRILDRQFKNEEYTHSWVKPDEDF